MIDPIDTMVGTRVQRLRTKAGLSCAELADLLQIDAMKLSRIEAGSDRAGPDLLDLLARTFSIPVWSFFHSAVEDRTMTADNEEDADMSLPPRGRPN